MKKIFTKNAPVPIGPFSQALENGGFVFLSGQVAVDPSSGKMKGDDIVTQTTQVFENVKSVLSEANLTLDNVIKTTVFLTNMNDFQKMNQVFADYFREHAPARSAVQVTRLPLDALVEIECIAVRTI